ncbi:hypothetical protein BW721_01235 [Jeotgalibaca sp. PTS2502]|nr:hypothetical protein BW721_01235 [Jeotgalibaca sp. PTS2502]
MTEKTGNIGFEEDRDEYEAENIIWVPKEQGEWEISLNRVLSNLRRCKKNEPNQKQRCSHLPGL